jgi:RNA polymerase sigma-70 factor, ECF subfamily
MAQGLWSVPDERVAMGVERAAPTGGGAATSETQTTHRLLLSVRQGDTQALDTLFARLVHSLERWARGRLPTWARYGADTSDLVQDALTKTFLRIDSFEPRRKNALRAYLQQIIRNRIRDAIRRSSRHGSVSIDGLDLQGDDTPLQKAIDNESILRYREGLLRLTPEEQELIVGRIELGYSYEQLALTARRPTPDAARVAVKRALLRLAEEIARA